VREAVFNALGSLEAVRGARVLDLFAGSGALGIEALSRGAASCVFVERDRKALAAIRANLAATGLAERATVEPADALSYLEGLRRHHDDGDDRTLAPGAAASHGEDALFDLALVDPPYAFADWDRLLAALPAALAVLESNRPIPLPLGWESVRERRYGGTVVLIVRPSAGQASLEQPPASPGAWPEQPE
jgi:16S rRNA (guanine966-N2)-methyltransferase